MKIVSIRKKANINVRSVPVFISKLSNSYVETTARWILDMNLERFKQQKINLEIIANFFTSMYMKTVLIGKAFKQL